MTSNHIDVLRPDFSFGHFDTSTLRAAIGSDLCPFDYELEEFVYGDETMNFMIDYYKDRALTREMLEHIRLNGYTHNVESIVNKCGNLPGREFVYAVQDARWSDDFLPAWYDREIQRKRFGVLDFETLPSSGFVSLAYLVRGALHSACICCPYITKISEYDVSECAYFYGQFRETPDDRSEFGFWYTENSDLIDQMRGFVRMLSDCQLDEDSLIF